MSSVNLAALQVVANAMAPLNHSFLTNLALHYPHQFQPQHHQLLLKLIQRNELSTLTEIALKMNQSISANSMTPNLPPGYTNVNGEIDSESEKTTISLWIKSSFYVVYVMICLLGIVGNAIVCYVVARNPTMHTVTNVFITNLALSDILLCIFAVPFTPLYLITFKSWVFGRPLCHLVPFAQGVSVYISAFTLMSIAIDRYFVILHPFKPRMQMKICVLVIITIWISASILTFPYAHFMEYFPLLGTADQNMDEDDMPTYYCDENWPYEGVRKVFTISTSILQFVIPFVIITFCYVKICGKLWDRARAIPGSVSTRREELERERTRKTNGMLISMVVIFVISWLPLNTLNLLSDFLAEISDWQYWRVIFLITHAIAMSSTCYNPFLYAWLNENFRKEFKEVLPSCNKLKSNLLWATLVQIRQGIRRHRSSVPSSPSGSQKTASPRFAQLCSKESGRNCHTTVALNLSEYSNGKLDDFGQMELGQTRQSLMPPQQVHTIVQYECASETINLERKSSHSSSTTATTQMNTTHEEEDCGQCGATLASVVVTLASATFSDTASARNTEHASTADL